MKILTVSKYRRFIFFLLGLFGFSLLVGTALGALYRGMSTVWGLIGGAIVGAVFCLIPMCFYVVKTVTISKKAKSCEKTIGIISAWKPGIFKGFGKVTVNIDGKDYSTDAYFTLSEAEAMVGKSVEYCLVGQTLFIYCVQPTHPTNE